MFLCNEAGLYILLLVTTKTKKELFLAKRKALGRNNTWYDPWSAVHFMSGILLGWLLPPLAALAILILWEPLEILLLSPLLARENINFGYESLRNSLSDIVVDIAGFIVGHYLLLHVITPSFHLF